MAAAAALMSFGNMPLVVPQNTAPATHVPTPATVHGWMTRLQPEELDEYLALERTVNVDARTTLFRENDESEHLYRVVKGLVKISVSSSSGRRLAVAMAGPGDLLDLASVISRRPYCVTTETVYSSVIAKVSREKLTQFFAQRPTLYELLFSEMVAEHSVFCGAIRLLGLDSSIRRRFTRLLLQWCQSRGQKSENGVKITVALTHEEIGEFISASRETVTRIISELREQRLIEIHGSTIFVPNLRKLAIFGAN